MSNIFIVFLEIEIVLYIFSRHQVATIQSRWGLANALVIVSISCLDKIKESLFIVLLILLQLPIFCVVHLSKLSLLYPRQDPTFFKRDRENLTFPMNKNIYWEFHEFWNYYWYKELYIYSHTLFLRCWSSRPKLLWKSGQNTVQNPYEYSGRLQDISSLLKNI